MGKTSLLTQQTYQSALLTLIAALLVVQILRAYRPTTIEDLRAHRAKPTQLPLTTVVGTVDVDGHVTVDDVDGPVQVTIVR